MRKLLLGALLAASLAATAQNETPLAGEEIKPKREKKMNLGIKAGYNIASISGQAPNYSPDSRNGFTVAGFYSAVPKTGIGYRTEIVFSRQGFEFDQNGKNNSVTNDYVYMPHFTTFGIGKVFQLQAGGQFGYLLKSSKQTSGESGSDDLTEFASRLDYGAAFGAEIYPTKNLLVGARYNVSFGNAYKRMTATNGTGGTPMPFPLPFNPTEVKGKNAVINFFVGVRF